jgi:hypothetical protein
MRFARRLLMVAGAVALAGILGVAVAPKAAHAIVATLVTVTNTTANPVGTSDANNGAFQPVRFVISVNDNAGAASLVGTGPTVPANKRLVVENISVYATIGGDEQLDAVWFSNSSANYVLVNPQTTDKYAIGTGAEEGFYSYNRPVTAYFDPGDTLQLQVFRAPIPPASGLTPTFLVNMYVTGHYVDIP